MDAGKRQQNRRASAPQSPTCLLAVVGLLLFSQAALAQWVVETSNDGDKTAYSEDTPSRNDEGGCDTEIHVFRGDDYDVVEFERKDWFKHRFDTEIDDKEVITSGQPYEDSGALIYNGSAGRKASDRAWKRIMRRERAKTVKLLSEHTKFFY
ncbi:MAG: hypothetical protein OXE74_06380 [Cyanobacteria bacterium MAG CAR2_bin_4]|nr:hypothetical protein [Cyanobacteria bacterium MAG CAR2_bin_4]